MQSVIVVLLLRIGFGDKEKLLLTLSFTLILAMSAVEFFAPSHFSSLTTVTILELLLGPLLIYYVQTVGRIKSSIPSVVYFLPPGAFFLLLIYGLFRGLSDRAFYSSTAFLMLEFLGILALIFYAFVAVTTLQRVRFGVTKLTDKKMKWLLVLVGSYLAQVMISFIYLFVYAVTDDNKYLWLSDTLISITIVIVLFWQGLRLKIFVKSDLTTIESDDDRWLELFRNINDKIKDDKLYLKHDLRITDIAKIMSTNSKYVSKAVNVATGESLTHYLNNIRLEHFKNALLDKSNLNINLVALAEECGFSSKSSFNRFFKAKEGVTPSEYRRKLHSS